MQEEVLASDAMLADTGSKAREGPEPIFTPGAVILGGMKPLGRGYLNLVYEHPRFPGLLIKVYDRDRVSASGQFIHKKHRSRWKFRRRIGVFSVLHRELREVLSLHARLSGRGVSWPVARIFGFVETDIGLGIVVEKITGPGGKLAPTVRDLVRNGEFSHLHRRKLIAFFDDLEKFHVCVHDANLNNIVLAADVHGGRFVAVDGLGTRAAIPVKDWFKWANSRSIRRHRERVLATVDKLLMHADRTTVAMGFLPIFLCP